MINITTEQKVNVTLKPVSAAGKPANIDTSLVPIWNNNNQSASYAVVSSDGMFATIYGVSEGTSLFTVTADVDVSSGTKLITGSLVVSVSPATAAMLTFLTSSIIPQ